MDSTRTEKGQPSAEALVENTRAASVALRAALHAINGVADADLAPSEWSTQLAELMDTLDRAGQLAEHLGRRFFRMPETLPGLETDEMVAQAAPVACRMVTVQLGAAKQAVGRARDAVNAAYQKTEHLRLAPTLLDEVER